MNDNDLRATAYYQTQYEHHLKRMESGQEPVSHGDLHAVASEHALTDAKLHYGIMKYEDEYYPDGYY